MRSFSTARQILSGFILIMAITSAIADRDDATESNNNAASINLNNTSQQLSGIETLSLKPTRFQVEFISYGKAISIQPLLQLHNRYLSAATEVNRATAKYQQAEQSIKRQQELYRHGVTAKRNLQDQQAQWQSDKALLDAAYFQNQAITSEALLNWGKIIGNWVLAQDSSKLESFLNGKKSLLQIILPADRQLPENIATIYVNASGDRNKAVPATLVSAAPQTDINIQGNSYFFETDYKSIKPGMNVNAWIPEPRKSIEGVIIPNSAIVWIMNQPFVYIKNQNNQFSRQSISNDYSVTPTGYFVRHSIHPYQQIVISGAQTLLSEELKGKISDDDD